MILWKLLGRTIRGYATKIVPFSLADIGEGINEVEMLEWKVKIGDIVKEFQPLCEVRSDKATAEITSRHAGKVTNLYCDEGSWAKVGSHLVDIEVGDSGASNQHSEETPHPRSKPRSTENINSIERPRLTECVLTSPRIRRAMKTYGFDEKDIHMFQTSGKLTEKDLETLIHQRHHDRSERELFGNSSRIIKPSQIRKVMSRRMRDSLTVPYFTACEEVDMGPLISYHKSLKEKTDYTSKAIELFASQEPATYRFSILTLVIKIVSEAILQYPEINSQFISDSAIRILENHNIGIAIDTDEGLVVPNIKKVEVKSIEEIYFDLHRLVTLSRSNKLAVEDISRGSFTLSNIGSIGSIQSQPLVIPPQSCIISLSRVRKQPRYRDDGTIYPASTMVISSSADHRVLDGAYLVRFLKQVRELIEYPMSLDRFV